jgi:hypothetical protein
MTLLDANSADVRSAKLDKYILPIYTYRGNIRIVPITITGETQKPDLDIAAPAPVSQYVNKSYAFDALDSRYPFVAGNTSGPNLTHQNVSLYTVNSYVVSKMETSSFGSATDVHAHLLRWEKSV